MSRTPEDIAAEIKALDLDQILDDRTLEDLVERRIVRLMLKQALEIEWYGIVGDGLRDDLIIF